MATEGPNPPPPEGQKEYRDRALSRQAEDDAFWPPLVVAYFGAYLVEPWGAHARKGNTRR